MAEKWLWLMAALMRTWAAESVRHPIIIRFLKLNGRSPFPEDRLSCRPGVFSSSPRSILYCLGQVSGANVFAARQIGDGACKLEDRWKARAERWNWFMAALKRP